jgi:hypothetical protein
MPKDLAKITAPAAEEIEIADVRIALKDLLHLQRQPVHAASHIRVARCDPNANVRRKRDHRRSDRNTAETKAGEASAATRTTAPPISTTNAAPAHRFSDTSAATETAAKPGALSSARSRRHRKIWLGCTSACRAIPETLTPGSEAAATKARFWSALHDRRRSAPEIIVTWLIEPSLTLAQTPPFAPVLAHAIE